MSPLCSCLESRPTSIPLCDPPRASYSRRNVRRSSRQVCEGVDRSPWRDRSSVEWVGGLTAGLPVTGREWRRRVRGNGKWFKRPHLCVWWAVWSGLFSSSVTSGTFRNTRWLDRTVSRMSHSLLRSISTHFFVAMLTQTSRGSGNFSYSDSVKIVWFMTAILTLSRF